MTSFHTFLNCPFIVMITVFFCLLQCQKCKAVYHMKCKRESVPCPKCLRLAKRGKKISDTLDEDYAYPHL